MRHKKKHTTIKVYQLEPHGLALLAPKTVAEIAELLQTSEQFWLDVINFDKNTVETICDVFGVHLSIAHDILNLRTQRPRVEIFDDYLYWISRFYEPYEGDQYHFRKVCTILVGNFVITFRDKQGSHTEALIEYLSRNLSLHSATHADYIALLMLNIIVESAFSDIDLMTEELELMEESVMQNPKKFNIKDIYMLKRKILFLRKLITPILDISHMLKVAQNEMLHVRSRILLRKIHDNCCRANEVLDLYQQVINNIYDMYLSTTNFYTNRSITWLTQFSTVFIPISFIAGVYGMNFKYMPGLGYQYAYPIVMGVMSIIAGAIWYYFKKHNQ